MKPEQKSWVDVEQISGHHGPALVKTYMRTHEYGWQGLRVTMGGRQGAGWTLNYCLGGGVVATELITFVPCEREKKLLLHQVRFLIYFCTR